MNKTPMNFDIITDELLDEILREVQQCDDELLRITEDIHADLSGDDYADAILASL